MDRQSSNDVAAVQAGQGIYSPLVLAFYDLYVLGFSTHLLWRCPTARLRDLYDRNVSARHLDVGVGTGYFLDRAMWPAPDPAITLLDLNPNSLSATARRIWRYSPTSIRADVLSSLPAAGPFDSVGLCYLLHCLPGSFPAKGIVFDRLRPLLAPGARIFGATIVQGGTRRSRAAQALMNAYNRRGVFSNIGDSVDNLTTALRDRFIEVMVEVQGTVAIFEASVP